MEEKFGFDSIITDEEYRYPFDELGSYVETPYFLVDEEEPDPEAFILAVAAYLCYDEVPGEIDSILFCDISPLIHPDRSIADYAVHCARRYLKGKADRSTDHNNGRKTIYHDIIKALEDILCSYSRSDCNFCANFPNRTLLDIFDDELGGCTPESRYYNDPFFAFAVCIYTSLRSHTTKREAASIMYSKFNIDEAGGCDRYDTIDDAILLVDGCLSNGFAKMFSPMTVIWHIILGLSRYYDDMSDSECDNISRDDYDDDDDDDDTESQDLSGVEFSPEIYADYPSGGDNEDEDKDDESVDLVKLLNSVLDSDDEDEDDEDEIDYSELEALFDDEYDDED